ncbi:MAG TPA: NAD(P)-dependent oxidoreductase [Nitrososphaeraceae archaeon]|nr:NAD(P)-dependent oxidoreductase [Nitrososphaeraceae archaeon]
MTTVTESIQNVGVIGLGRMGTEIANNVIKSGFKLVVYNRTVDKTRALAEAGAVVTASPKEAASKSDVILTSLRDDAALLDVVNGEKGILSGLKPGTIHIGTSTISPSLSTTLDRMHDAQGSLYLAAPVLGNPAAAKEGKLTTFVAGDTTAIKSCKRLLNSYCQRVIEVGNEHAKANILKLSANYVMLTILDVMGQVYALAEKSDIDLQLVNEVLEMIFAYPGLKQYAKRIRTRDFDNVGFDLLSAFKDVQLILQTSSDVRVPLSHANNIQDRYIAAIANDMGKKDWISIYDITRMLAGLKNEK